MTKQKCRIAMVHDFPDYPCKICSPRNWWYKKIINEVTNWSIIIAVGALIVYCIYDLFI
jgi:hypothetical protein